MATPATSTTNPVKKDGPAVASNGASNNTVVTTNGDNLESLKTVLYRMVREEHGFYDHFYTTSAKERDEAKALGYKEEGSPGRVLSSQEAYTVALRRFINSWDHYYTASQTEFRGGYRTEDSPGFVYAYQAPGTIPLYQSFKYDTVRPDHFYTTDKDQHDWAVKNGYQDEGVTCYIFPSA